MGLFCGSDGHGSVLEGPVSMDLVWWVCDYSFVLWGLWLWVCFRGFVYGFVSVDPVAMDLYSWVLVYGSVLVVVTASCFRGSTV